MAIHGCIERIAAAQLSPKSELNPALFDKNGLMHEAMRQRLLDYVQIYLERIYNKFEKTQIRDICMVGSQASYFYHKNSDIDIAVDIVGVDNGYLKEDYYKYFHKFISNCSSVFLPDTGRVAGFFVDVKPYRFMYKYEQQYSLLHNRWVEEFKPEMIKGLTVQQIIDTYYEKLSEINQKQKEIFLMEGISEQERNRLFTNYHNYLVFDFRNESYLMNIIYRILNVQKQIQRLGQIVALNDKQRISQIIGGLHG